MSYSLVYFEAVRADVREAKSWYKEKRIGLEIHFAQAVKAAIVKLQKNPLAYSVRYKNVRIIRTQIFPYGIHFYIDPDKNQIVIVAIIHNRRHPATVSNRVK